MAFLVLSVAPAVSAHEPRTVGEFKIVVGWASEPAVAGYLNAVQIVIHHADDGDPETRARLKAIVSYGGTAGEPLPLEPSFGAPGDYRAPIVPTSDGSYTFRITGSIAGVRFDQEFTSGEKTFDDVKPASALEFPQKPPTRAELVDLIDRTGERSSAKANDAANKGSLAMIIGIVGVVLGVVGIGLALRKRSA